MFYWKCKYGTLSAWCVKTDRLIYRIYRLHFFFTLILVLSRVIEVNAFLSEPALHLFLQSNVHIPEMENHLLHASLLSNIRDVILQSNKAKEKKEQRKKSIQAKCDKLRRSLSLDSLSCKVLKEDRQVESGKGRGWSRYIGEGYHSFASPSANNIDGNLVHFLVDSTITCGTNYQA